MLYKELTLPFTAAFKKIPSFVFNILFYLIIGFTFLGCVNFLSKQGLFIFISLLISIVYIVLKRKLVINLTFIFTLLFAISYSIPAFIFYRHFFVTTLMYAFSLLIYIQLFYCFENKRKLLIWLGGAFLVGLYVSFLLTVVMTYWTQGLILGGEVANNFWTHALISRTGISLYVMGFLGVCIALLFFKNKYTKFYTIPAIILFIFISIWFSLKIGNRSFLVAFAILIYSVLFIKTLLEEKWIKWLILACIVSAGIVFVLSLVILYGRGLIKIPEVLLKIRAIDRLFNTNPAEGRPEVLGRFFTEFYKYPFGNYSTHINNGYVHNILFDFYTFGGAIPFAIVCVFFVFLVLRIRKFFSIIKGVSKFEKGLLLCIIFSIVGIGIIEPIYQANPNCFTIIFLIFLYMDYICKKCEKIDGKYVLNNFECINVVKEEKQHLPSVSDEMHEFVVHKKGKITKKASSAIILITFEKADALKQSFNNLLNVEYYQDAVDLVISIDNSGLDDVEKVAKGLVWPYGDLIIRTFDARQGLKKHVLHCFEYAEKYDVIFVLEDDIYCSKAMYSYGIKAAKFYDSDSKIAGISLYNFQGNWQNWALRFEPLNNGYDTYFIRLAQSWGEVLTTRQWLEFKKWLGENPEFVKDDHNVETMNKWPESSWLKFFDRYCILNNKFFVYPYCSVVSNCNGVGIHNSKTVNDYQVELQGSKDNYVFQSFDMENPLTVYYDEYFDPLFINTYLGLDESEITIDLWCTKPKTSYKHYVLTAGYYGRKFNRSWSLSLHPIELSIQNNIAGNGIYLYDSLKIKSKKPRIYALYNYSLRNSDWRRVKFYSLKLFIKTYWTLLKKKIKKSLK